MGQRHSDLSKPQLKYLRHETNFTTTELIAFHKEFLKVNPTGRITKPKMIDQYRQIFPDGDPRAFIDQLFSIFDANEDGMIDFREFICGMGLLTRGNPEQKLRAAFRMCDLDNNGGISKSELEMVITAIYNTIAPLHNKRGDKKAAASVASAIFRQLDKNQDDKITFNEFVTGAKTNPDIVLLLETMSS